MANANAPRGCRLYHGLGASYTTGGVNPYFVPSSYGTDLFLGDPVVITGTSNTVNVNQYGPGTLPEINRVAPGATNPFTGFIVGFETDVDTNLNRIYNPANTQRLAWVADDPNVVMEIQDDGSAVLDETVVGLNANFSAAAGNTFTGLSGFQLDATTPIADQTFQLKILRLIPRLDNELGAYAKWLVRFNPELHTSVNATI